jgi:hypothetical protein
MLSVTCKPYILKVVMLNVIMLSVVMLSVIMLSVVMLSVIMLSVVMLSVIMLSVIILSFPAPLSSDHFLPIEGFRFSVGRRTSRENGGRNRRND